MYCCKKTPPTTVEACRHLKEMIEPSVREARFTPEEMSVTEDELKERRDPDGTVSYYHPDQPMENATTKEALLRKLRQYREPERHAELETIL